MAIGTDNVDNTRKEQVVNNSTAVSKLPETGIYIESTSDSEVDDSDGSVVNDVEPHRNKLCQEIARIETTPAFGHISVTKSSGVHFGNKTFINGPVTIHQFIGNKSEESTVEAKEGQVNAGFEKSVDDDHVTDSNINKATAEDTKSISTGLSWICEWGKRSKNTIILTVCVVIVINICTLLGVFLRRTVNDIVEAGVPKNSEQNIIQFHWCLDTNFLVLVLLLVSILILPLCITVIIYLIRNHNTTPTELSKDDALLANVRLRLVERKEWLAQPPGPMDTLKTPVPYVIITHTATEGCTTQSGCVFHVRFLQTFHIESRNWSDIAYNFMVGGDGSAYEGRGWDKVGAHTKTYNNISIGIAFVGTFNDILPPKRQLEAAKKIISLGVQLGKISKNYKLFGHRQLIPTLSPGDVLFNEIKTWPHWSQDLDN